MAFAALFVLLLYVAAAARIAWCLYRSPYTVPQSLLYFCNLLLTRLLWRASTPGKLPIPSEQGAVLIANHRSSIDPFFLQQASGRVVHWMVAKDFFAHPFFGAFLKFVQAIPTRRSGVDTASTKMSIRLAANGGLVGMFPEGRINTTDDFMVKVRPGAVMIALKAKVPIIPCYIHGSPFDGTSVGPLMMPAKVTVKIGEPIDLSAFQGQESDKAVQAKLIVDCVREIAKLAGRTDFEPEPAGRTWIQDVRSASFAQSEAAE